LWGIAVAAILALTVAGCGSGHKATAPPTGATGPGAGDEEPIRVPAHFEVRGGRLTPAEVKVPAFLTVELEVRSRDDRPHTILLAAPRTEILAVPPGGRASLTVPGLQRGRWELSVDGHPAGAIVAGSHPGP
jgi:hypothetical protein